MIVLVVSPDESRLEWLKEAVQNAGLRIISARGLDEAWAKSDFFDFGAVVIDHQLKDDYAASAFRQRFITLDVGEDGRPETLAFQLATLFGKSSELVQ